MKSINIRLEQSMIDDIKMIAKIYNSNSSEIIRSAINNLLEDKKNDIFYKLSTNINFLDEIENKEIISELKSLTEEDIKITSSEIISL